MATHTEAATEADVSTIDWNAGLIGGVTGGVIFGVMMTMMMPTIMEGAIPGMYGLGGGMAIGWVIHVIHSMVLGAAFAVIVGQKPDLAATTTRSLASGVVFGVVLWAALATFVMPAWVGAMTPMAPPVPDVNPLSLVGHIVYGALLGGVYATIANSS